MSRTSRPIDRREALKRFGATGGAAALALAAPDRSCSVPPPPQPPDPAELKTATYGGLTFQPVHSSEGYSFTGTDLGAHSTTFGTLVAPLSLPPQSMIKAVDLVWSETDQAQTILRFGVQRIRLTQVSDDLLNDDVATAVLGGISGADYSRVQIPADDLVHPEHAYVMRAANTSPARQIWSAKVSYAGPYSFVPLAAPVRVVDTTQPPPLGPRYEEDEQRIVSLASAVPAGARAVQLDLAMGHPDTVYGVFAGPPTGFQRLRPRLVSFGDPTRVTIAASCSSAQELAVSGTSEGFGGAADFAIDVTGYFA